MRRIPDSHSYPAYYIYNLNNVLYSLEVCCVLLKYVLFSNKTHKAVRKYVNNKDEI